MSRGPDRAAARLLVVDGDTPLSFGFDDLSAYHGGGSPGGVAHAFKVMERAFGLLGTSSLVERRQVTVATAFGGPGARDGFELVTRAVTGGRFELDPGLARPQRGVTLERFVFVVGYRGRAVTLTANEGFVSDELIALVCQDSRTAADESRLVVLKGEMADLVMASPADDVYAVD